ncbi:MAG: carboxypeptidase regulatory-like domain-containing protein, partial [Planctomycetes bacterium]|nr:carboxypeptidase regulatory-like domain-containing protein [Planctomycetota bacterium]
MNGRRALFLLGAALLLAAAAGFALFRDEPPAAAPEPPAREDASPSEERGAIPDPALREEARAPEPAASAAEEPSPVPETRPAPRGPGIQGIVVDAESGAPVPGALVTAYELDAEFAADGDTGLHETVAGAGGSFLLAGPFQPGGGVLLSASANGWRSPFPYASVRMGQSDLVQQVIRVVRAPSLAGRVLDPERRGVRAVIEVRARDRWFCCVESGEDGTFLLDDVAGRLDLWSATRETPIHVWAEHEAFRQGAATTTLADVLAERPVEIVLERGAALAGRALDLAGGPITGARMRCYPLNDDRFSRVRETETGQDGSFRVAGLGAGPHRLEPAARAGALAPARRCLVLDLAEQEERPGIEVLYLPGHSLGGQARDRSDETPLAGRLVTLHHSDWLDPLETLTDHAGRFLFPAVSEGDYTVVLRGASWSDPVEPVIETNVPAGRTDILLEADVEPRDGSLHLALRDAESGRPLSGSVFVELRWSRHGLLEQRAERLQAGAEGSVSLPLLERTRYWLEAAAPGFAPAARTFELSEARPEARLEIGLRRPISISGRVTDGAGRPIERA